MVFCAMIFEPMLVLIRNLARSNAKTMLLRIPMRYIYLILPISMVLMFIRLFQDSMVLYKESEENLGKSKPSIDFDKIEAEAAEIRARKEGVA